MTPSSLPISRQLACYSPSFTSIFILSPTIRTTADYDSHVFITINNTTIEQSPTKSTSLPQGLLNSNTTAARATVRIAVRQATLGSPPKKLAMNYTVFIRLPFPRNGFEDPPPVDWTSTKDRQLWKLISSASNSKDLDWEAMSERFDVPLAFLLQQAAWLYERHFEGMRAQMKRLGAASSATSAAPSPRPEGSMGEGTAGNAGGGGVEMGRKGSNGDFLLWTFFCY